MPPCLVVLQLMYSMECGNPLFGTTTNPHNSGREAGGSSGGQSLLLRHLGIWFQIRFSVFRRPNLAQNREIFFDGRQYMDTFSKRISLFSFLGGLGPGYQSKLSWLLRSVMRLWRCGVETIHVPDPNPTFHFVADLNLAQNREIYVDDSCRPLMDTFVKNALIFICGPRSHESSFTAAGPWLYQRRNLEIFQSAHRYQWHRWSYHIFPKFSLWE